MIAINKPKKNMERGEFNKKDIAKATQIEEHLRNNIASDISVNQLAEDFIIKKSTLQDIFKIKYGSSVYQYLLVLRMKEALRLLEETDLPVKAIAKDVGYSNDVNFIIAFKKYYEGKTPSSFRREVLVMLVFLCSTLQALIVIGT